MFIRILDKQISFEDIGIASNFSIVTIENLECFLQVFDGIKVCQGIAPINKCDDINSSIIPQLTESYKTWRHFTCSTIITKDNSADRFILFL